MKTKDKPAQAAEALRPYVKRAMEDPELREDLLAAFVAARGLYGQIANRSGVKGKAEKISEQDFQKEFQELVADISDAADRIKDAGETHKARNRVLLLTGVTLGVLFNPWTGQATRDWIMNRVTGENGDGFEEFGESRGTGGNGSEPPEAS
jgi:soluble cytochrome b562